MTSTVERMRLNLGCADRYALGWVNVDWEHCPHRADQTVNLASMRLPWEPGTIAQAYCGHLFEHIARFHCYTLARNLLHLMEPGPGEIMVVGPDMHLVRQMLERGERLEYGHSLHSLRDGAHRWPGDEHLWEPTEDACWRILREAGWPVVTATSPMQAFAQGWPVVDPTAGPWQVAVRGYVGPTSGFKGQHRA